MNYNFKIKVNAYYCEHGNYAFNTSTNTLYFKNYYQKKINWDNGIKLALKYSNG